MFSLCSVLLCCANLAPYIASGVFVESSVRCLELWPSFSTSPQNCSAFARTPMSLPGTPFGRPCALAKHARTRENTAFLYDLTFTFTSRNVFECRSIISEVACRLMQIHILFTQLVFLLRPPNANNSFTLRPAASFHETAPKQIDSRATSHNDKPIHFTRNLASLMFASRIISHSLRPHFAHQIALLLDRPGVGKRKGNPQSFRPYSSPIIRLKWYFNMAVNITGPVIHYLVIPFNGLHARVIHRPMQKLVDTNNDNSIMFGNTFHGQALLGLP
jgi:hypothetical protein